MTIRTTTFKPEVFTKHDEYYTGLTLDTEKGLDRHLVLTNEAD